MKRLLRDLALILALAGFWALGGYLVGAAIEFIIELLGSEPYPFGVILASINVIVGMLLFKGVTRDPTAERFFFEGPEPQGEGDIRIGCLWAMPAALLLYGLLLWIAAILFRLLLGK